MSAALFENWTADDYHSRGPKAAAIKEAIEAAPFWERGAILEEAVRRFVPLDGAYLVRTEASDARLGMAQLRGAKLACANLSGADLQGADLRGADFHHAVLSGANLARADLREADFTEAKLIGADLSGANLQGADLTWAKVGRTDFRGADLRGAKLPDRDWLWRECDLRGALMDGTMTGAELRAALATIGWSQRELARRLGIDEARVRRWARDATPVPGAIAAWLATTAAWVASNPPPKAE